MIYRAVFLIFVFALNALADDQEKWIKVRVTVSAPDSMKAEALSFLTRELRALGDVEIVDTLPDYQIAVVALELSSRASTVTTGYAVSAIVGSPVKLTMLKNYLGDDDANRLFKVTGGCQQIYGHYLRITSPDRLAKLCESLIAEIDGDTFEGLRKSVRKFEEEVERLKKEQQSKVQ
jgi:hypothetical protein